MEQFTGCSLSLHVVFFFHLCTFIFHHCVCLSACCPELCLCSVAKAEPNSSTMYMGVLILVISTFTDTFS